MIKEALKAFEQGKLVAVPTETVYGLAAPIDRDDLIEKIYEVKKRPKTSALSIQVSSIEMAKQYTDLWTKTVDALVDKYWPGPLTIILPKNENVSDLVTAHTGYVGLRMPDQKITLELIRQTNQALAVPSANLYGLPSPKTAKEVRNNFSDEDVYILDGGPCTIGTESTIVKITHDFYEVVRIGAISKEEITDFIENFDTL